MARSADDKAAAYNERYGDAVTDVGQMAERQERIELKQRRRAGGRGVRYYSVPELPWKRSN